MRNGNPSMVALLGLLAVAGYKNKDRLAGLLNASGSGSQNHTGLGGDAPQDQGDGIIDNLRQMFGGPGGIAAGLSDLLGRFSNPVQAATARTWVDHGPNGELGSEDLADVLDDETVSDLTEKTGLSRQELLTRLSAILPQAVDQLTPHGRLPTADEARAIYQG